MIQSQAFGKALDPHRLDNLARYEAQLDRKLERSLAMLIRLQDLRRTAELALSVSQYWRRRGLFLAGFIRRRLERTTALAGGARPFHVAPIRFMF